MAKITKNTTIGEALEINPNAETILQGFALCSLSNESNGDIRAGWCRSRY